ncbi:hypothetical protein LTR17_014155 [Elasticomyces elasticus]|nr:hypothetical protein LTR17_014155 [Elasticomyces elasticus]
MSVRKLHKESWVNRYLYFREHSLHKPLDQPPTNKDLCRFIETMLNDAMVIDEGKDGPNAHSMWKAVSTLISYATFTWPDFKATPFDRVRLSTFIDRLKSGQRLQVGRSRDRTWLGYSTLLDMVSAFLRHAIEEGTINWDATIARCLGVTLMAALGCRSGDIALANGYYSECWRYKHIELSLVAPDTSPTLTLTNLTGVVKLYFAKGEKDRPHEFRSIFVRPYLSTHQHHMCPIS